MSLWRQLARGVRALARRRRRTARSPTRSSTTSTGPPRRTSPAASRPSEARRAARLELGSATGVREEVRGYGWENAVDDAARRPAVRRPPAPGASPASPRSPCHPGARDRRHHRHLQRCRPDPVPAAALPGRRPGRHALGARHRRIAARRHLRQLPRDRGAAPLVRGARGHASPGSRRSPGRPSPSDSRASASARRTSASWAFRPRSGGDSRRPTDRLNGPEVVVLGHGLWRRRFGADPAIIGRPITLDDDPLHGRRRHAAGIRERAGPRGRALDAAAVRHDAGTGRGATICAWWGGCGPASARTTPGASSRQSRARRLPELTRPDWAAMDPALTVIALHDDLTRGVRPALLAILGGGAAGARHRLRQRDQPAARARRPAPGEFALRAALGAGRGRLIRQLLTESLLLAALGGAAGMAVAMLGVRALVALSPPTLPRAGAIAVERHSVRLRVWRSRRDRPGLRRGPGAPGGAERSASQVSSTGSRRACGRARRARSALVVAEVALALVLLVGSGLLLRSLEPPLRGRGRLRLDPAPHDAGPDGGPPVPTTTARRTGFSRRRWRPSGRSRASRPRRSPASCR